MKARISHVCIKNKKHEMRLCVLIFSLAVLISLCFMSTYPLGLFHVITFPLFGVALFTALRIYYSALPLFKKKEPHVFSSPRAAYDYGKQNIEGT